VVGFQKKKKGRETYNFGVFFFAKKQKKTRERQKRSFFHFLFPTRVKT